MVYVNAKLDEEHIRFLDDAKRFMRNRSQAHKSWEPGIFILPMRSVKVICFLVAGSSHPVALYSTERLSFWNGGFFNFLPLLSGFKYRAMPLAARSAAACRAWEFKASADGYSLARIAQ